MVLLYIMQQRDILYYQLRVYNENNDNTIDVDAIKGSEEGAVDDDECFFAFSKAFTAFKIAFLFVAVSGWLNVSPDAFFDEAASFFIFCL